MFAASRWMTCRTFPRRLLRLPRCCLLPLPGLKSTFPWSLGQACSAKRRSQWKTTRPCRWSHLVCTSIGPGLFSHRTMCQPVILREYRIDSGKFSCTHFWLHLARLTDEKFRQKGRGCAIVHNFTKKCNSQSKSYNNVVLLSYICLICQAVFTSPGQYLVLERSQF